MKGIEVRERIVENEKRIDAQRKDIFVLDREVQQLEEENKALRRICEHEFDTEEVCVYCGTKKNDY